MTADTRLHEADREIAARAAAGDARAFEALMRRHNRLLFRAARGIAGDDAEAEDAVQETLLRAWRGLGGFDGRASLRTWLTRIATHVCLDALHHGRRRARPIEEGPAGTVDDALVPEAHTRWIEPAPAALLVPADDDPARRAALR